jgi:hypothetical protein
LHRLFFQSDFKTSKRATTLHGARMFFFKSCVLAGKTPKWIHLQYVLILFSHQECIHRFGTCFIIDEMGLTFPKVNKGGFHTSFRPNPPRTLLDNFWNVGLWLHGKPEKLLLPVVGSREVHVHSYNSMYSRSITKYFLFRIYILYYLYTVDSIHVFQDVTNFSTTFRCVQTYKSRLINGLSLHTHTMMDYTFQLSEN